MDKILNLLYWLVNSKLIKFKRSNQHTTEGSKLDPGIYSLIFKDIFNFFHRKK